MHVTLLNSLGIDEASNLNQMKTVSQVRTVLGRCHFTSIPVNRQKGLAPSYKHSPVWVRMSCVILIGYTSMPV